MNMFKAVAAKTVDEYINNLDPERKKIVLFIHDFIQKVSPSLKPHFAYNMLGYGSFKYSNYKKDIIDWPTISLASQKNYISLYVCSLENGEYIAEKYKKDLGKVNVGRSCIRFKKIEDLKLDALEKIIKKAAENPGLR